MTKLTTKFTGTIAVGLSLAVLFSLLTGCPPRKPTPVVEGLNGPPAMLQANVDRGTKMRNSGQRDCHTQRIFTTMG